MQLVHGFACTASLSSAGSAGDCAKMAPLPPFRFCDYAIMILIYMLCAGNYFGTHFIMGGERFDTPQPEAYLFGENADLNFLGSRPTVVRMMHACVCVIYTVLLRLAICLAKIG